MVIVHCFPNCNIPNKSCSNGHLAKWALISLHSGYLLQTSWITPGEDGFCESPSRAGSSDNGVWPMRTWKFLSWCHDRMVLKYVRGKIPWKLYVNQPLVQHIVVHIFYIEQCCDDLSSGSVCYLGTSRKLNWQGGRDCALRQVLYIPVCWWFSTRYKPLSCFVVATMIACSQHFGLSYLGVPNYIRPQVCEELLVLCKCVQWRIWLHLKFPATQSGGDWQRTGVLPAARVKASIWLCIPNMGPICL